MAVRFKLTDKGLVQFKDQDGVASSGISPYGLGVSAVTSTSTVTDPGAYTVSGSAVITLTIPDPTDMPMADIMIRSLSAHAHIVSASAISVGVSNGAVATLGAVVGTSFVAKSDGLRWLITAQSGTVTLSG